VRRRNLAEALVNESKSLLAVLANPFNNAEFCQ
jgi:hypothetical protein